MSKLKASKQTERLTQIKCHCGREHTLMARLFYQRRYPRITLVTYYVKRDDNKQVTFVSDESELRQLSCGQFHRAVLKMSKFIQERIWD